MRMPLQGLITDRCKIDFNTRSNANKKFYAMAMNFDGPTSAAGSRMIPEERDVHGRQLKTSTAGAESSSLCY